MSDPSHNGGKSMYFIISNIRLFVIFPLMQTKRSEFQRQITPRYESSNYNN